MAEDPLGDRLRASFAAERDDLERRFLAEGAPTIHKHSLTWIPFAVAAVLIAIVGFAFIGNRSNDQAVDLDIAAQDLNDETPPTVELPAPVDESGQPLPTPIGQPDPIGMPVPYLAGQNMCGEFYNATARVVSGDEGASAPALAEPETSGAIGITRMLTPGTMVELTGGCTRAQTIQGGAQQWYEIKGLPGQPNDWVLSDYLSLVADGETARPTTDECGVSVTDVPHFVWDVAVTDPDGGLIAHTAAGVNEPLTRVIGFNEIVAPTGACVLAPNGAPWYEVRAPGLTTDWVNARYLRAAEPACLQGEQFGTQTRSGWGTHVVATGDRLSSIATFYSLSVDELIRANPQMNPNLIIAGQLLSIPGLAEEAERATGPLNGWAVADGDRVAFSPDPDTYRWYPSNGIRLATQCDLVAESNDSLAAQACMRVAQPVTDQTDPSSEYGQWLSGEADSPADHVHDIRTESDDTCTRVVVTFGDKANEDGLDAASATLPPIVVDQGREFVRISPNGWAMESAFMDTDRIDYPGGIGLLALYPGYNFAVELMHREMEPNVRFLDNPARVVIDLFPIESPDPTSVGPFGESFVLRGPIQQDLNGPGIAVDNNIVVAGFGRPFEAAGLYRIWSVPENVDPDSFLADPPAPLIEEFFPTSGWAEGWGSFLIDLPELQSGTYIAVFGELPPTDEIGFYGTGQLFRVTNSPADQPGNWPEAVLLPNVQLPPEF